MLLVKTVDDVLKDPDSFEAYVKSLKYEDTVSPIDNVSYPLLNLNIPKHVNVELDKTLEHSFNNKIKDQMRFMRLTTKGTPVPHQVHTDITHGDWTALFYPSDPPSGIRAGTALIQHIETGMQVNPRNEAELLVHKRDMNRYSTWEEIGFCDMKKNRLSIIPSHLFHRAEPVNGYGKSPEDGRIVLITFFTMED